MLTNLNYNMKANNQANKKLEEVHIKLWKPHYSLSLSGNMYTVIIIIDVKTQKFRVKYL